MTSTNHRSCSDVCLFLTSVEHLKGCAIEKTLNLIVVITWKMFLDMFTKLQYDECNNGI